MLSDIITENGLDLGIATPGNDFIIVSQLAAEQLAHFSASPFQNAIALLEGDDYLVNDNDAKIIYGNQGNDTIIGGNGNDTIFGGQDNDLLEAGNGNNILFGNFGNDTLIGGPGNDSLYGGAGNDVIIGGPGNSIISGDKGLDTLTGGGGANQFILQSSGADRDIITDFQPGIDKLRLPTGLTFNDLEVRGAGANTEIVRSGEVVAVLNGVMSSSINSNDFITAGQETPPLPPIPMPPISVEPGDTPRTAGDLGVFSGTQTFRDFVGTTDSNDYYRFTLNQVHDVELTLFGMDQNADLELYIGDPKPDGSVEIGDRITRSNNLGTRDDSITRSLGAGTYFVRVFPQANRNDIDTRYSLTFEATPTGIVDQAGNTASAALDLGILEGERNFQDFVGTADRNDYYRFTLAGVRDFNLDLFGMRQNADVELYVGQQKLDGSWELGNRIERSINLGTTDDSITRSLGAGTYFVRVFPQANRNDIDTRYSLRLNATP
ncbi:MAG: calcium-binding protein [Limnospira sp. PMC 737.11]|uniref:calcium-binding protein n=1 Tax=Limnospira sp. PMC 737.11 TaxID=2981095 RepID=UPI0028E17AC7|nr:calcium-binding protein [Limnospira sp. PMC 737.11]MDT9277107.1 calcium-binding protein [Limnospira sp. PMC 737.11]